MINTAIFKDYDVRGIYPEQINGAVAQELAHAIVRVFQPKTIAICRDMRLSGEEIRDGLIQEFLKLGINVTDLGLGGTEIQYFVAGTYDFDLVLMISASHNPPQYNGLKVAKKGPIAVTSDSGLYAVRDSISLGKLPYSQTPGTLSQLDVFNEWKEKILSLVDTSLFKPFKVVVDAGNGMAGKLVPIIFESLPFTMIPLYFELNGAFPNHIPNPLVPENTTELRARVISEKADLGLTFDGDADRMFLVDDTGRLISGTITTALLSRYFLEKFPGETILYNAICGRIVPETIEKYGGKSMRVRVGHSYIKTYMKETNAIFAGEHSGHYYLRDYFSAESGVLTGLMVLSLLSVQDKKLSELVDEMDVYPASGELNFKAQDIPKVMDAIRTTFTDAEKIDELDGISVWYKDYWFNVRASKTEPLLRLNIEADTKELLEKKQEELIKFMNSHDAKT